MKEPNSRAPLPPLIEYKSKIQRVLIFNRKRPGHHLVFHHRVCCSSLITSPQRGDCFSFSNRSAMRWLKEWSPCLHQFTLSHRDDQNSDISFDKHHQSIEGTKAL
eukprot:TRINITY_DN6585_c0_g1_i2.p1 TRINITY_DN6585_c0_g1~~TRINITY_DN6585_c0_g1_i2.p1  ORF type:complete len:105 (-),score=12.63 TRINITY_DN6585_c0_g1_i2:61-375(-)